MPSLRKKRHILPFFEVPRSEKFASGIKSFILKADCSKIGVSPLLWDIFTQLMENEDVRVPLGVSSKHSIQIGMLLQNQREIGWENFLFGRISYDWNIIQKMVTSEVPRKCDTSLHLFWRVLFVYFCQLWRERCFYVTMLQREEESNVLDVEIKNMEKRDWTRLAREDR